MVTTQYLADLISLASMIWTQDNIIGSIVFFGLVVAYLILVGIQANPKYKKKIIPVLVFLLGIVAIPATFSTNLVQSFLIQMLPCSWRSGILEFLNTYSVPLATIISFLQSFPSMFPSASIPVLITQRDQYKEKLQNEIKCKHQKLEELKQKIKEANEHQQESQHPDEHPDSGKEETTQNDVVE